MKLDWADAMKTGCHTYGEKSANLCTWNNRLYMVYLAVNKIEIHGETGTEIREDAITWYEGNTADWAANKVKTNLYIGRYYALGIYHNLLYVAASGEDNTSFELRSTSDGLKWNSARLEAMITFGHHDFTEFNGRFFVANANHLTGQLQYLDTDKPYWTGTLAYGRDDLKALGEECFTDASPSVVVFNKQVLVAFKEKSDRLWRCSTIAYTWHTRTTRITGSGSRLPRTASSGVRHNRSASNSPRARQVLRSSAANCS